MRYLRYIIPIVGVLLLTMFLFGTAPAQCAMCRASLAGSNNASFVRNLNIGVLVLLVPPVTIFCSIFIVLKRRNKSDE